jgi:dynein heavy chain
MFDDNTNDDFPNEIWVQRRKDEDGHCRRLYGKALVKDQGFFGWRRLEIVDYNAKKERFKGIFQDGDGEIEVHRLYLCFDSEDPRKFVRRLGVALNNRIHADSLIRYNHYIDNMPT